ncbi:MAG: hypothetical protein ABR521_04515 [Gaiellaceae bacterium]
MTLRSKQWLALVATVAALGAGGAAIATTQAGSTTKARAAEQPFLSDVAGRVGVRPDALLAAIKAEAKERVDAAVAAGKLPAERAARIKARIDAATLERPFAGARGSGFKGGPGARVGPGKHGRGHLLGIFRAAASYIGIDARDLRAELAAGRSLAEVATANGRTVAGLKQAILAEVKARLDRAPRLSAERKAKLLARLSANLDRIVNLKRPRR